MILLLTENPVGILYLGAGALTLTCAYVEGIRGDESYRKYFSNRSAAVSVFSLVENAVRRM